MKKRVFDLPPLFVTTPNILSILIRMSSLVILTTTVLPAIPPFHVAIFSFLVFTWYMHLEILMQWETIYFHCCHFQDGGEISWVYNNIFASWYCGFPPFQKTSCFLETISAKLCKPRQARQDGGLKARRTICFEWFFNVIRLLCLLICLNNNRFSFLGLGIRKMEGLWIGVCL